MLVPIDELPPLVIASPGCEPTPLTILPGQFPRFTSTTNPWYLCEHAIYGVIDRYPVFELPWASMLFNLTEAWNKRAVMPFLSTPRLYPHRHADSLPDSGDELEDDDSSSYISTPDEDSVDGKVFQSWSAGCATDNDDMLPSPIDEDIDDTDFIHIMQRPPAWTSDSEKGIQWLHYLLAAAGS